MAFSRSAARVVRALPLAFLSGFAGLGCAGANAETPVTAAPVAPSALPSTAAAAAPVVLHAGGIPADSGAYLELRGLARVMSASASKADLRAEAARAAGLSEAELDRLIGSIASAHLGLDLIDGAAQLGFTVRFGDAAPLHDLIAHGTLRDAGDADGGARRLVDAKAKDVGLWFEGQKLLAIGDRAELARITEVVTGRAKELVPTDGPASFKDDGVGLHGFVTPNLLERALGGALTFGSPFTLALDASEGGISGAYRVSVSRSGQAVHAGSKQSFGLAKLLPSDTLAYLAVSTDSVAAALAEAAEPHGPVSQQLVRGGPDPGPEGFEVAAEGDLNGDGTTSLFTIVGRVDPATHAVRLSPIFTDKELE